MQISTCWTGAGPTSWPLPWVTQSTSGTQRVALSSSSVSSQTQAATSPPLPGEGQATTLPSEPAAMRSVCGTWTGWSDWGAWKGTANVCLLCPGGSIYWQGTCGRVMQIVSQWGHWSCRHIWLTFPSYAVVPRMVLSFTMMCVPRSISSTVPCTTSWRCVV